MPIGGPIIDFVNLFGLGWLGTSVGYVGMTRFLIWILFFALFQGVLTSSVSPSFIGGKKRIASVLSLAISLLVAIGIPSAVIISMLAGFGILGATSFIVIILGGYGLIIRKVGEGEDENMGHIVGKFFITVVTIAVLSAFEAATSGATGGMPPGVITSYNEIIEWAILIPTILMVVYLWRMFTFNSADSEEEDSTGRPESASAAERRRANKFRFVESRLLKAREHLEQAESAANNWTDPDQKVKAHTHLRKANREVHQAWTQLRRVRRSDRETREMANNFAARMQVYENMINDLIRINGRRP